MLILLKRLYRTTVSLDYETRKVTQFVHRASIGLAQRSRTLEVGCGRGRYLRMLSGMGFDVTGVDANPELVRANREAGFRCLTAEEFKQSLDRYDVMLMSHVIEHFAPQELL